MKFPKLTSLVILALLAAGCSKSDFDTPNEHTRPVMLAPYLYDITFTEYDSNRMDAFVNTLEKSFHGAACSAVRNGRFIGRNLDFYYDETAEFVIHVPAAPGRYASIGVSSCNFCLTKDIVDSGKESPYLALIPFFTVDGVNEKGVYASINMVPPGDLGVTKGTNPGAPTLCASMVVRYVLDNCASAEEACQKLEKMNITTLSVMGEFHYLIADNNDTYIVELINNKLVYSKDAGNIITNYYLFHDGYTPHSCGIERYNILKEHYAEGSTLDGMDGLLQRVHFGQAYNSQDNPLWYSDFNGFDWKGETLTMDTPLETKREFIEHECERFQNKKRDLSAELWITVHESVYDIQAKTLRVYSQEDYSKYHSFTLN